MSCGVRFFLQIVKKSNVSYFTSMRSVNSFAFFFINGMTSFFTFGNGVFNSIIFAGFGHGHSTLDHGFILGILNKLHPILTQVSF